SIRAPRTASRWRSAATPRCSWLGRCWNARESRWMPTATPERAVGPRARSAIRSPCETTRKLGVDFAGSELLGEQHHFRLARDAHRQMVVADAGQQRVALGDQLRFAARVAKNAVVEAHLYATQLREAAFNRQQVVQIRRLAIAHVDFDHR